MYFKWRYEYITDGYMNVLDVFVIAWKEPKKRYTKLCSRCREGNIDWDC